MVALVGDVVTGSYGALPNLTVPDPVIGGLAVLGALAAPFSVLAGGNVQDESQAVTPAADDVPP